MDAKALKIEAARAALTHVESGMRLGIGTGSTAEEFVRLLAEKVSTGIRPRNSLCSPCAPPSNTLSPRAMA